MRQPPGRRRTARSASTLMLLAALATGCSGGSDIQGIKWGGVNTDGGANAPQTAATPPAPAAAPAPAPASSEGATDAPK